MSIHRTLHKAAKREDRTRAAWRAYCLALPATCSQCGQRWSQRACGPGHASIAAARTTPVAPRVAG